MQFRANHLGHPKMNLALFWMAESYRHAGQTAKALVLYEEYARRYPEVADHFRLRRGQAMLSAKEYTAAVKELEAVVAQSPGDAVKRRARRLRAEALLGQGNFPQAAQAYRELYASGGRSWVRAELLYLTSEALRRSGNTPGQLEALKELVRSFPRSRYAAEALETILLHPGAGVTPFQEGRVPYYQRRNARALEAFQRQQRSFPASIETPWARYLMAIVYERLGRNEEALQVLQAIIKEYPTHAAVQDALWEQSWLLEAVGRHAEAAGSYREFWSRFPGASEAEEAQFKEGLNLYKTGDLRAAAKVWSEATIHPRGSLARGRSTLWLGKTLKALGDEAGAQRAYAAATREAAGRYYAFRSESLQRARPFSPEGSTDFPLHRTAITLEEEVEALASFALWSPEAVSATDLVDARDRVAKDNVVRRGDLLGKMGLPEAAAQEYRDALRRHYSDAPALFVLAHHLHEQGQHAVAIAAASALLERAPGRPPAELPRALLKILYPLPFLDQVVPAAEERGIDPLLIYALMRQESLFVPWATSSANAKGLTQVIPSTAQDIARSLGLDSFDTEELYRPAVSIRFGAVYLGRQLEYLARNPAFALAAHNGGPGNALRWMGRDHHTDPDLFVENIDYTETALFVRLVLENYAYYQLLYREVSPSGTPAG